MPMKRFVFWLFVLCAPCIAPTTAAQELGEVPVVDFEHGLPADWTLSSSRGGKASSAPTAELEKNGDNTVLELGKDALLTMSSGALLDFALEATVRREYDNSNAHVGFQFRNGYRAYLRKPGRVELTGPNQAKGRGFSRNRDTVKPVRFGIVVVGTVVRFFVDGEYEGQFSGLERTPGPVCLYQQGVQQNVYFDDVKLTSRVDPRQFLVCEPVVGEDQALVFDPGQAVSLSFDVTNLSDQAQQAALVLEVATFDGKEVFAGKLPAAALDGGGTATVQTNLGQLPEGFYRVRLQPTGETFPLAVHARGTATADQLVVPKILTGVYWYYFGWELPPVWWNTYLHAACNDLRKHHFNTVVCAIGMPSESLDIFQQYGLRCFVRGAGQRGNVSHPTVLGGFVGDEPHEGQEERYLKDYPAMLSKYPEKLFTTCMIGDGGVDGCRKWWDSWRALPGGHRVIPSFRWYGIKKSFLGIARTYATRPPLTETLRDMSQLGLPYYFIMPSFGSNKGLDAYYGNPLPSQIRCMMHLGAAFQATGLIFWTYQTPFPDHEAFVDPVTLLPLDGKWAAAGEAAKAIQENADLLAACTWKGRYAFVKGPSLLEVFELAREGDDARYFYVVNTDCEQAGDGRLFELDLGATLRDLFHDRDVPLAEETVPLMRPDMTVTSGTARLHLEAGDGVLLRYVPPMKGAAAAPRVTYPPTVANAPADKVLWLAEVEPLEMPVPGWFPALKFKGKKWFPDYNSNDLLLYSGPNDAGQLYQKSLWAHAETTIKYRLPEGASLFAAAAGFGNKDEKSSAIFRVIVDGEEKFNSGVRRLGTPVMPVVVDVAGGEVLELITEEAGDGLYGDYTFWGEARLIRR